MSGKDKVRTHFEFLLVRLENVDVDSQPDELLQDTFKP